MIEMSTKLEMLKRKHEAKKRDVTLKLGNYFQKYGVKSGFVKWKGKTINISYIAPSKQAVWNGKKLTKVLRDGGCGEEEIKEVVKKKAEVRDWNVFIEVMKNYKVPPMELNKLINVSAQVDEKRLKEVLETTHATKEDIQKCCILKEARQDYLRITESD